MTDLSNPPSGAEPTPTGASDRNGNKGARTVVLLLGALGALGGAYLLFFLSMLMIGFSFDAPGSHFTDSGLWLRLLMLWPPVSLLLVAIAAAVCIFRPSLRLLWIALGLFAGTIVAISIAMSLLA
jgi:hypothetical protein